MSVRSAETADARRDVEGLLCDLTGGRDGALSFEEPWEIRAFAIAIAAHRDGLYEWPEFQGALIESIRAWEEGESSAEHWSYYEHWVRALEQVVGRAGLLDGADIEERTHQVLATPPNKDHHKAHTTPVAIDPATTEN